MNVDQQQVFESTDAQLRERLAALRKRYDPKRDGGGYPMPQLRELHLILDEMRDRERETFTDLDRAAGEEWVADNHVALDRATDVERYR